jgi:hypothetical protein
VSHVRPAFGKAANAMNTFVSGPLTADRRGSIYYSVLQLNVLHGNPWNENDVANAWLVKVTPEDGRHERMHLTLKREATRPAAANILQQQAKFDAFLEEFNQERPHEALAMKCPAEIYSASCRAYRGIPEPHYPFHDRTVVVTSCGRVCLYNKKINLSVSLAGQAVGVKEVDHGIWLVSFMDYDLGYIDLEEKTLQPLENPFGPKV